MRADLPEQWALVQRCELDEYAVCLDGSKWHGWLFWRHPDGQWVSQRKCEQWEIMQAEDQRDLGIVHNANGEPHAE